MPVIDQMPRCLDRCFVVVGDGGIGEQPRRRPVDEHQRRTLLAFYMKVALILSDRVQDQSIDPPTVKASTMERSRCGSLSELAAMTAVSRRRLRSRQHD